MKRTTMTMALMLGLTLATPYAAAEGRARVHGAKENAEGGVTAGSATAYSGPGDARGVRGHAVSTDGAGDAKVVSGGTGKGPNGGSYGRAGSTRVGDGTLDHKSGGFVHGANGAYASRRGSTVINSNGSVQHSGAANGSGPNGSFNTAGNFSRNPDGTYSGQRSTTATGANGSYSGDTQYANGSASHTTDYTAKNGDTYAGDTTWTKGEGVTHSGTCKDASGKVIACPR